MAYTLDQLTKMGAKPVTVPTSTKSYTADQLQTLGAKPINAPTPSKQPGLLQSLAAGIAQPFARLGTNLEGAALGVKSLGQIGNQAAFNQTQQQIQDLKTNGQTLPVVGNVKPVGQTADFGQNVKDAVGTGLQVESVLAPYGKVAKLGTELTAPLLGKVGSRLAGTALSGAAGGYAADVGNNLTENKSVGESLKPGVGTALGAVLPVGVEGAIEGAQAIRSGLGNSAPRVINSLIRPLLKDFSYGKNPGRAVAELGITGNSLDELGANIATRRQAIGQEAAQESRKIPQAVIYLGKSLKPLDEAITKAASNNNSSVIQRLTEVKDAITKNLVVGKDGAITSAGTKPWYRTGNTNYAEALAAKQKVGELTKFTGNPSDDKEVNMALKKVYGSIKQALNEGASKADPEVAAKLNKLNERYADLKSAEIATTYRDKIQSRQNLIGLTPTVAGIGTAVLTLIATGGAALPAVLAGVSGAAIDKALSSPAFKTRLAAWLAKLAPAERDLVVQKFPQLSRLPFPGDHLDAAATATKGYLDKNPPSLGLAMKDVNKMGPAELGNLPKAVGDSVKAAPQNADAFEGFDDITTNLLDDLKGRKTVSKQYVLDALNRSNVKQAEKDIIKPVLDQEGPTITVKDFANKVKSELLPLEVKEPKNISEYRGQQGRYQNVALPDEIRGEVANYREKVYESPIKTSAGDVHFYAARDETPEGYFAHTRVEDMADESKMGDYHSGKLENPPQGDTRRVIEVQSDLFQKGRLEREGESAKIAGEKSIMQDAEDRIKYVHNELSYGELNKMEEGTPEYKELKDRIYRDLELNQKRYKEAKANIAALEDGSRKAEINKLKPYENSWQDRIVREEVKQAAKDGKTKLQFPTGDTAMKIEGLGGAEGISEAEAGAIGDTFEFQGQDWQTVDATHDSVVAVPLGRQASESPRSFTVSDVQNDRALQLADDGGRQLFDELNNSAIYSRIVKGDPELEKAYDFIFKDTKDMLDDAAYDAFSEKFDVEDLARRYADEELKTRAAAIDWLDEIDSDRSFVGHDGNDFEIISYDPNYSEQIPLGNGEVDTDHPIYKYYENELGKFLKKKYNAERITDGEGVTWYEVNVPEAAAKEPVKAFGKAKIGALVGGAAASAAGAGALAAQPQPLNR